MKWPIVLVLLVSLLRTLLYKNACKQAKSAGHIPILITSVVQHVPVKDWSKTGLLGNLTLGPLIGNSPNFEIGPTFGTRDQSMSILIAISG